MAVTREGELCLTSCHFSDRDSEVSVLSFKCLSLNELISIFVINIPFIHSVYAVNRMNGLHRMYAEWFTYLNRMYNLHRMCNIHRMYNLHRMCDVHRMHGLHKMYNLHRM